MVAVEQNQRLYLLGHSYDEERRLSRQAEELRQESARLFDRIGMQEGSRAIDLGCGPQGVLDLLSERVGATGHVTGVERNRESLATARRFVADRALQNVGACQDTVIELAHPIQVIDLALLRYKEYLCVGKYIHAKAGLVRLFVPCVLA